MELVQLLNSQLLPSGPKPDGHLALTLARAAGVCLFQGENKVHLANQPNSAKLRIIFRAPGFRTFDHHDDSCFSICEFIVISANLRLGVRGRTENQIQPSMSGTGSLPPS